MSDNLMEITDETFEENVLQANLPVLVDFWAPWCGPCKAITPVMEELAAAFKNKIKFTKCNVDDNPSIPAKYGIQAIPTIIFFKNGAEADRFVGMIPKAEIEKKITNVL